MGRKTPNVAKIVALSTILGISGLFSFASSAPVFADSLTLTIPSSPLSLDLNPTINNGFSSTSGSFNVKTDSAAGYTTSIKSKNENGDNSLINGNNKLSSISSVITEDTFKNGSEYINMWGWMPSRLNSEDNTNYQVAPGTEEVVLDKTETANAEGQNYNISLAAKVASDTPTGTYTNTFVVTALSNATPKKEYEPTECWGLSEGQTGSMTDPRDGTTYNIARLADGKCWMTENLRITGSSSFKSGHTKTLTSEDSDLQAGEEYELPDSDISKFNIGSNGWNTTEGKNNDAAYVTTISYNDSVHGAKNFESGYYTWHTATAGTGTADQTTEGWNAPSSICPKGWKLPTSGSGGDFETLTNAYGISNSETGSNTLRGEPLNFTYAGGVNYSRGVLSDQGSLGSYWSSTVYGQSNAYYLYFYSSRVVPTNNNNRPYGNSVRCVARGEKPENKGSMQTVNQWGDSVQEGETVLATDERDNAIYSVARLEDGELWMTQNLRIGSNEQQTVLKSDTSDVASDFTLPVGTTQKGSRADTTGWHYEQYNTSHIYIKPDTNYGGYYTWFAATAGEGTQSKSSGDTSHSICPKGWRLPTSAEITTLTQKYDTTTRNNNPPNFGSAVWAGYCYEGGCPRNSGSNGFWWSSTAYGSIRAYYLRSNSSGLSFASNYRGVGYSVRCVARKPKTISDLQYMQDWDALSADEKTQVLSSMEEGTQYTLTDNRDNTQYTVAKLKDGKIWMTQNLAITGSSSFQPGHSATLNSSDSDVSSDYPLPNNDISKFNVGSNGYQTTKGLNNDAAYVTTTSYTDSAHGAKNFESGYYTWHTATAGTGTADQTTKGWNAPSSICPKGWRLPTGGSGGDFQTLTNAYSISDNTAGNDTLRGEPLNFTYAGYVDYSNGVLRGQGSYGYYWSSTVYNQNYAYSLNFYNSRVGPIDYGDRPRGRPVRCVAR